MKDEKDVYQVIAEKHFQGESGRYRKILELLMTPIQAEIVAELPASFEKLARTLNMDIGRVKHEMDELFWKGVVIPKNFHSREGARFCRTVAQLHDATLSGVSTDESSFSRLCAAWQDFAKNEWHAEVAKECEKREDPRTRVIPAYSAIQDLDGITSYDDVQEILKTAPLISVVPCSCRRRVGKKNVISESCIQFGRSAEYAIARGSGRKLTFEEAMTLIDKIEEDGEIHTWSNARVLDHGVMCNCTTDACILFTPLIEYHVPLSKRVAKSRFVAVVEKDRCNGCQQCLERCQFNAVDLVPGERSKKLKANVDTDKCWGCGLCVIACETGALTMKLDKPLEHIPEVRPRASERSTSS
jgi:NAD-dependent dihydropyrimidine dehydrogenase PreA subunit